MALLRSFIFAIALHGFFLNIIGAQASHSETQNVVSSTTPALSDYSTVTALLSSHTNANTIITSTPTESSNSEPTSSLSWPSSPVTSSLKSIAVRASNDDSSTTASDDSLPLTPRITPAFAVGGILLMLTGFVCASVGFQHRRIYVFLSSAYLVSLCIAVLILHLINPPISAPIQGAYLVAIAASGLLVGGIAAVFPDYLEGCGCLIGGFCFSMWLLVLKSGGLVTGTAPITVFILVFTIAIGATAYFPLTKPYGLTISLAFAGATAIVLGIDCFSRAGLKEFWAYIWNVNGNMFPPGTSTYPFTSGIKVEIAVIPIVAALGILSQLKVRSYIKRRRDRRSADRVLASRGIEHEEAMVGRRLKWQLMREKEQWEAVYRTPPSTGRRSLADSGITDMEKDKRPNVTELQNIAVPDLPNLMGNEAGGSKETVAIDPYDTAQQSARKTWDPTTMAALLGEEPAVEEHVPEPKQISRSSPIQEVDEDDSVQQAAPKSCDLATMAALSGEAPVVEELVSEPNSISQLSEAPSPIKEVDDEDIPAALRAGVRHPESQRDSKILHRLSHNATAERRLSTLNLADGEESGPRLLHRLVPNATTGRRDPPAASQRKVMDGEESERASSVGAMMDDLASDVDCADLRSLPNGTPRASIVIDEAVEHSDAIRSKPLDGAAKPADTAEDANEEEPADGIDAESADAIAEKCAEGTEDKTATVLKVVNGNAHQSSDDDSSVAEPADDIEIKSVADRPPTPFLAKEFLPAAQPKVATSYRTYEWAQQLPFAEVPVPVPPSSTATTAPSSVPGSGVSTAPTSLPEPAHAHVKDSVVAEDNEAPAPVDYAKLLQTAATGGVAPAPLRPRSPATLERPKTAGKDGMGRMSNAALGKKAHRGTFGVGGQIGLYQAPDSRQSGSQYPMERVHSGLIGLRQSGSQLAGDGRYLVRGAESAEFAVMERQREILLEEKARLKRRRAEEEKRRREQEEEMAQKMRRREMAHRAGLRRLEGRSD